MQNTSDPTTPYASNSVHYQSDQRLQIKEQSNSQQLSSTCFDQNIHPR